MIFIKKHKLVSSLFGVGNRFLSSRYALCQSHLVTVIDDALFLFFEAIELGKIYDGTGLERSTKKLSVLSVELRTRGYSHKFITQVIEFGFDLFAGHQIVIQLGGKVDYVFDCSVQTNLI